MKPKKLIRGGVVRHIGEDEWEFIENQEELNKLYALKIKEELKEIQDSNYSEVDEFVDLIQVAYSFAKMNGFTEEHIAMAMTDKTHKKGIFTNVALNNLNPNNPSNDIYFSEHFE